MSYGVLAFTHLARYQRQWPTILLFAPYHDSSRVAFGSMVAKVFRVEGGYSCVVYGKAKQKVQALDRSFTSSDWPRVQACYIEWTGHTAVNGGSHKEGNAGFDQTTSLIVMTKGLGGWAAKVKQDFRLVSSGKLDCFLQEQFLDIAGRRRGCGIKSSRPSPLT